MKQRQKYEKIPEKTFINIGELDDKISTSKNKFRHATSFYNKNWGRNST